MTNFIQNKIAELKDMKKNIKKRKLTKRDAALGVSIVLAGATLISIANYNPGLIPYSNQGAGDKKPAHSAEFSKLAGPQQSLEMSLNGNDLKRKMQKKVDGTSPASAPSMAGFNPSSLPSSMPNFAPPTSGSINSGRAMFSTGVNVSKTYQRHTELTDGMRAMLSSSFTLTKQAGQPNGGEDRFQTTFEYANDGNTLEKFELMSIVRTPKMQNIKTAQEALSLLVEESGSINVIESTDSWLLYDYAGDGGYQIGKIELDDNGIYIFGYINLTTSDMPEALKADWINKFKSVL